LEDFMAPAYKCYQEIWSQQEAWQEAVDAVLSQKEALKQWFMQSKPDQIIFVGCTTPYFVSDSASIYWQTALNIPARAVPSSELLLFPKAYYLEGVKNPLMILVSRSGKTTETIWAAEEFERKFPGRMLFIGCRPESRLGEMAHLRIGLPNSYEDTVPQTRSATSMYLALQLICSLLAGDEQISKLLKSAPRLVNNILNASEPIAEKIARRASYHNSFWLGSGPLYGIAREANLKLTEMSITDAFSYPFLESRHGPRSLIDPQTLVVGMFSRAGSAYETKVIQEYTHNLHAVSVAITPNGHFDPEACTYHIPVHADWPDEIIGLAYLPVTHLIAYYWAIAKGVNPDLSRNTTAFVEIARETR
jgi:glucosamine--fructose-6-phosphate aminotransferase (isomerizing)